MIQSIFVTFIRIYAPVEQVECALQLHSSNLGALAAQHLVDALRIFVERMNGALGRRWALSPHSLGLVANRQAAGRLVPPSPFSWIGARRSGLHLHKTAPVNVAPTLGATSPRPRGLDWGRTGLPDANVEAKAEEEPTAGHGRMALWRQAACRGRLPDRADSFPAASTAGGGHTHALLGRARRRAPGDCGAQVASSGSISHARSPGGRHGTLRALPPTSREAQVGHSLPLPALPGRRAARRLGARTHAQSGEEVRGWVPPPPVPPPPVPRVRLSQQ